MNSNFQSWIQCRWNRKRWLKQYAEDEWFDVLTPKGGVLGKAPRSICHQGPKLLHPVVHLHVLDSKGRLYLQRRSWTKDIQPGKWDSAVGGHVDSGEKIEDALRRESREELGISGFDPHFIGRYIWEYPVEAELVHSYWTVWDGEIKVDPHEIEEGRFRDVKTLESELNSGEFTPNFLWEWRNLLNNSDSFPIH